MATRILLIASLFLSLCAAAQQVQDRELQISSPIIPIVLKTPVAPPTAAQAKDFLLWYKGKKIDDSTLITPQATIVRWSKPRDIVIVQPKKDPSFKIIKELANTQKRKEEYYNKMAERKSSVMLYPAIVNTMNEFDDILKKFTEILKNIVKLTSSPNASAALPANTYSTGGVASIRLRYFLPVPDYIKNAYNKVMSEMKKYPPIDFPPPPSTQFSYCVSNECDSNARKKLNEEENNWNTEFIKYEAGLVQQSISIFQKLEQLKLNADPEAIQMRTGLDKAMEFAVARVDNKVDLLIRKYGNDFTRLPSVLRAAISAERQKQLLGKGKDTYATTMQKLLPLFDGFEKYLEQQMDARNYDVALNMAFVIGVERQRQLLGASDENKISVLIDRIKAFNRFKIEMEMDYDGFWDNCGTMKDILSATSTDDLYLSLGLVDCKYRLVLSDEHLKEIPTYHYGYGFRMELKVRSGSTMESKIADDNCYTVKHDLKGLIIGPKGPFTTISFCKDENKDTLTMSNLHLPGVNDNADEKRYAYWHLTEFDRYMRNPTGRPGWKELPEELAIEFDKMRNLRMPNGDKPSQALMEKHYYDAIHREYLLKKENEYENQFYNPSVVFDAKNGDEVIIDETLIKEYRETSDLARQALWGEATFKIKIKVTHAPLPYKKTAIKKN